MQGTTSAGAWNQLSDRYYRKYEIYRMSWADVDMRKHVLSACPHGGPVAAVRDPSKLVLASGDEPLRPFVRTFTNSGRQLGEFTYRGSGSLAGLGWSLSGLLLCVSGGGEVSVHSPCGSCPVIRTFSLSSELQHGEVLLQCHFWESGFAAIVSQSFDVVCVVGTDAAVGSERAFRLAPTNLTTMPRSWVVVPNPAIGQDEEAAAVDPAGSVMALLSPVTGSIIAVDSTKAVDMLVQRGPFTHMCASAPAPGSRSGVLACFAPPMVWVAPTNDLGHTTAEFSTDSQIAPEEMAWCGPDSVVMYWDQVVLVVGPGGDVIKYTCDLPVHIFSECDGLRLISAESCEWLERVPDSTEAIFGIGSLAPGAMLNAALEHLEERSPKAEEDLRAVRESLAEAVDSCLDAAMKEWNHAAQRSLMRAASLGRAFVDAYPKDKIMLACKTLRVLNAVRQFESGLPVMEAQLRRLGLPNLVARLCNMRMHLLAHRACECLGESALSRKVITAWACAKVTTWGTDASLGEEIFALLKNHSGVPYAKIAEAAYTAKKIDLARNLIDRESRASEQIPLLLRMEKDDVALQKALDSGDSDLTTVVILGIVASKKPGWFEVIRSRAPALDLLISHCRENDQRLLESIYETLDMQAARAKLLVTKAHNVGDVSEMIRLLREAQQLFANAARTDAQAALAAKATEEQVQLLLAQRQLDLDMASTVASSRLPASRDDTFPFFGMPLAATISRLLRMDDLKNATKLKNDFKVSDRKFWWLRLKAIAAHPDPGAKFTMLERLAKEKKSPVGYEPFADICIECKAMDEASKYVSQISDQTSKATYWSRIGRWREAAECAFKEKNRELLESLNSSCPVALDQAYIASLISQMK